MKPNLVSIDKNKYSFYKAGKLVVKVVSEDMDHEFLEFWRRNPEELVKEITPPISA